MTAIYTAKSLDDIVKMFRSFAERERANAERATTQRDRRAAIICAHTWMQAASYVEQTTIVPPDE